MASNYAEISDKNESRLGSDTSTRKTQIDLYSDPAHFIYELLQNADDYGAQNVAFHLTASELTIEHDGTPFITENVEAITYFCKGTSQDDQEKIGRFGIGFKSVFAFTASPIIYSGDEHFRIYELYRAQEVVYPHDFDHRKTRIVLPFNHEELKPDYVDDLMSSDDAYRRIEERLGALKTSTLLFTRNIREISWSTEGSNGHYRRKDEVHGEYRVTSISANEVATSFLVFSRTPANTQKNSLPVSIAFALDVDGQITESASKLFVLFPTLQDTHLRFILDGPYRTAASRESVKEDNPHNVALIEETSQLLADALLILRDLTLLTPQSLAVFPQQDDGIIPLYEPLLLAVKKAFSEQKLVPTTTGSHELAIQTILGPAAIRAVLKPDDMCFLCDEEQIFWAKGSMKDTARVEEFLRHVGARNWGWEEFERTFRGRFSYSITDQDSNWLAKQEDAWIRKLYNLIGEGVRKSAFSEDNYWPYLRIIRVCLHKEITHMCGNESYLPKGKGRRYGDIPQVKQSLFKCRKKQAEQLKKDLECFEVSEIDEHKRIERLLDREYPFRPEDDDEGRIIPNDKHLQHMKSFVKLWKMNPEKFSDLSSYPIFKEKDGKQCASGEKYYLDTPFIETGLHVIYDGYFDGIKRRTELWPGYLDLDSEFIEFAVSCGVMQELNVEKRFCYQHPHCDVLMQDNPHGEKAYSQYRKDVDWYILECEALLELHLVDVNRMIWNCVRKSDSEILRAEYRPNRNYEIREDKSSLILCLEETAWIPDREGKLHKPKDIAEDALLGDFYYDNENGWLSTIGFGESARVSTEEYRGRVEAAHQLGIEPTLAEKLSNMSQEEQLKLNAELETTEETLSDNKASLSASPQVRGQLISYVASAPVADRDANPEGIADAAKKRKIGDAAEEAVMDDETRMGRTPERMCHENRGYDITSVDFEGNKRYIEVKGTDTSWGDRGVTLSTPQFNFTKEYPRKDFWLYVVEYARDPSKRKITRIQDPASKVDKYAFDSGWRDVGESA